MSEPGWEAIIARGFPSPQAFLAMIAFSPFGG
jgi:hypothetical protein